jgi:hypothetical protein
VSSALDYFALLRLLLKSFLSDLTHYLGSILPGLASFPINRIAELTPTAWQLEASEQLKKAEKEDYRRRRKQLGHSSRQALSALTEANAGARAVRRSSRRSTSLGCSMD